VNLTLMHDGDRVREFYSKLPRPVLVGIEATGSMHWFLNLMDELGMDAGVLQCNSHSASFGMSAVRVNTETVYSGRREAGLVMTSP
jgi:transposase